MSDENCDKAYDALKAKQEGSAKAKGVLRSAGYARGGGVSPMKKEHKEEKKAQMKKHEMKKVEGDKPKHRADKFARGGNVGKKSDGKTHININMGAAQQEKAQAAQMGAKMGAQMMAQKIAGGSPRPGAGAPMQARPPMAPPGAPPPGGPQGVPPTMGANRGGRFAKGGKVSETIPKAAKKSGTGPKKVSGVPHMTAGGAGAIGRLEKAKSYGPKPKA